MREILQQVVQSSDFRCGSRIVWGVLTDFSTYGEWYGWPEHATPMPRTGETELRIGSRLRFHHFASTKVVTELVPESRLTISDEMVEEDFLLEDSPVGCRLTITISLLSERSPIADKLNANALEMLRGIKSIAYSREASEKKSGQKKKKGSALGKLFRKIIRTGPADDSAGEHSDIISVEPGRLIIGAVCLIFLFAECAAVSGISMPDEIPSSGVSPYESPKIEPSYISEIEFDWSKDRLETELDCIGTYSEIIGEYIYESSGTDGGSGVLYVSYDSYGYVRRYAYVDQEISQEDFSSGIQSLDGLSSGMSVEEVAGLVGEEPSGYVINRSGAKTIFFGFLSSDAGTIFSPSLHAELNVNLNSTSGYAGYQYFWKYGSDNPLTEMPGAAKAQENSQSEYLNDRYAFEKVFILYGLDPSQCSVLLGAGAETREDEMEYQVSNPSGTEDYPRYEYDILFRGGTADTILFTNTKLATNEHDVTSGIDAEALSSCTSLGEAENVLGILPSRVACDADRAILYYGTVLEDGQYPLSISISRETLGILEINYSESDQ
ncbi:MAG: hypothetical protein ACOX6J_05305 [Oscillospiraceae bacterium]